MLLCSLILSGCGSGCPTPLCPLVEPATPIEATLRYRLNSDDAAVVIATGSSGETIEKTICERWSPNDPRNGQTWDAARWAQHLQLFVSAVDQDAYRVRLYTDDQCNIHTALPLPQSDAVEIEWTGSMDWSPAVYTLTATCRNKGETLPDSNPDGCNTHLPVEPPVIFNIKVYLWHAHGTLTAPTSVVRGETVEYKAEVVVDGFPTQPDFTYDWASNWFNPPSGGPNPWSGKMVTGTTVVCQVRFPLPADCALDGGTTQTLNLGPKSTAVTARDWSYTPPDSAAEDNDPAYEPTKVGLCDNTGILGILRDEDTKSNNIFWPNPAVSNGSGFLGGVDVTMVGADGPNHPLFYVEDVTLKIQQETAINRLIKPDGPPPIPGVDNWFAANETCFVSPAILLEAVKKHENNGTHTDAFGFPNGHYGLLKAYERLSGNDVKEMLEHMTGTNSFDLLETIYRAVLSLDNEINAAAANHSYVQGNWSALGGVVPHHERVWRPAENRWSVETNGDIACDCLDGGNP